MWKLLIVTLFGAAFSFPTSTEVSTTPYEAATISAVQLQKDVALVSYIQNFKSVMAAYVYSQHRNLTVTEMERVKITLEEFLTGFANDLRDTLQGNKDEVEEVLADGIPDETFADIKRKIVQEFPDISEETAEGIVRKLRRNLFETRRRIDEIIRDSQRAQIAYS